LLTIGLGKPAAAYSSYGGNCVLYVREATGIQIAGNAGDWWDGAEGRYRRGHTPTVGAVLVFKPYGYMRSGHVAVVSGVASSRMIMLDQANWVPGRVIKGMAAVDSSLGNDWSMVRVVDIYSNSWGRDNPTFGFIYPDRAPRLEEAVYREDRQSARYDDGMVQRYGDGMAQRDGQRTASAPAREAARPAESARAEPPHQRLHRAQSRVLQVAAAGLHGSGLRVAHTASSVARPVPLARNEPAHERLEHAQSRHTVHVAASVRPVSGRTDAYRSHTAARPLRIAHAEPAQQQPSAGPHLVSGLRPLKVSYRVD